MNLLSEINNLLPTYTVELPFSKKEVEFTPFRIKDIKNLSIVLQEQNKPLAFAAMVDILKRSVKNTNVMELTMADAEFLFLKIRSKSVDEILNLIYNKNKIQANINDIKYRNSIQDLVLDIGNNISIQLKTPLVKDFIKLKNFEKEDIIKSSIKSFTVKNELYECNKFVPEELKELLNNLPITLVSKFDSFLKTEPQLYIHVEIDGETKEVAGLLNFFSFR